MHRLCWVAAYFVILLSPPRLSAAEPKLPSEAKVQRNETGQIVGANLSGSGSNRRTKIARSTIEQLAQVSTLEALDLSFTEVNDESLAAVAKMRALKVLNLSYSDATGKAIAIAAKLPELLVLQLEKCEVSDEQLKPLAEMPKLIHLNLSKTQITDAGMASISALKELVDLELSSCEISDEGLRSLGKFKQLQNLKLAKTVRYGEDDRGLLTDASVDYLSSLTTLISLDVADSGISKEGIASLSEQLPKTKVNSERHGVTYLPRKNKP